MEKKISIYDAIAFGFRTTWKHIRFVIALNLSAAAIGLLLAVFILGASQLASLGYPIVGGILFGIAILAVFLVGPTMTYGYIKALMEVEKTGKSTVAYLYQFPQYALSFFIAAGIYSFVGSIGLALLIIPGLLWLGSRGFFDFIMIEKHAGPFEALAASAQLCKKHYWQLAWLYGALIVLSMVLGITIIGSFFTWPIFIFSRLYVYRKLSEQEVIIEPTIAKEFS